MAFQLPQRNVSGGTQGSVVGAHVPAQQDTAMSGLFRVVAKVGSNYLKEQTTKELAKRNMEGQQAIASGTSLEEIKSEESWVNKIYGSSATLDGARQAQAEASFYNGFNDLVGQMDELKTQSPEEFNKYITTNYSKFLTKDDEVNQAVLTQTSKFRSKLMNIHAKEHTAWVQEENIKGVTAQITARTESSKNMVGVEIAFGDEKSVAMAQDLVIEDMKGFLVGTANKGNDEQKLVAQQVVLDLRDGNDLSYEATKDFGFTMEQKGAIQSAKIQSEKANKAKKAVYDSKFVAEVNKALEDSIGNPTSSPGQNEKGIYQAEGAGVISASTAATLHQKNLDLTEKQNRWEGLGGGTGAMAVDSGEVDDFLAYKASELQEARVSDTIVASNIRDLRNRLPVSASYSKKITEGIAGSLTVDDRPNTDTVTATRELISLARQSEGNVGKALRQIKGNTNKARFLQIYKKVESGDLANPKPIEDAIFAVDQEEERFKASTEVPKSLKSSYREDADNYKADTDVIEDVYATGTVGHTQLLGQLRLEMDSVFKSGGVGMSVENAREIAFDNIQAKRFDDIGGLTDRVIGSDKVLRERGDSMFFNSTTQDQVAHALKDVYKFEGEFESRFNQSTGNFIVKTLGEDGTETGYKTIPLSSVSKSWESSSPVAKKSRDMLLKKGLEVPSEMTELFSKPTPMGEALGGSGASRADQQEQAKKVLQSTMDYIYQSTPLVHVQDAVGALTTWMTEGIDKGMFATGTELGVQNKGTEDGK